MQIGKMFFPITSLGPGNRLGIWTMGCARRCIGCSNPELQSFNDSNEISIEDLLAGINYNATEGVTISGGEPFLQAGELAKLVEHFILKGKDDILIFTGFTIEELRAQQCEDVDYVLNNIAVLIDGPFDIEKIGESILKGSSNQVIHILNEKYKDKYNDYLKGERQLNIISMSNGETHFVGIPPKNYEELYNEYVIAKKSNIFKTQEDKNE